MLIERNTAALLVVDIQERLLPVVADPRGVVANSRTLIRAASGLGVPVLASVQYPRGIGALVAELANLPATVPVIEKISFSCVREPEWRSAFEGLGRPQAVIAGIEAHVCVLQTALDLLAARYQVFVVADAVSSRAEASHQAALDRLRAAGAGVVTTEMVVFEWLERADTAEFKKLMPLIK